ncbi:MAG: aromatic ring-hydroxylating dioxygenase subunit alpha, partial [Candidatus Binatia bacterium]
MDKIWHSGWVYVGHESEVPETGSYVTRQLGVQPIIIVRDLERNVNLFLNRCRHRGNTVCQHEHGRSNLLRCEYHGWTYSTRGE